MSWINSLLEDYHRWIKSKTSIITDSSTGWAVISTPFIGIFNDTIDIYAQKKNDHIILSDNGETLSNLELVGVELNRSERRKEIADKVLLNYGVTLKDDELRVETTEHNFPQKKHNMLAAMIELNDMYMLAPHKVASIFKEDVRAYLDENEIVYTPDFISKGSTGLEFTFDFQIAHKHQEVVLKAFNSLNRQNLPSFLFAWEDIKSVREKLTKKNVKAIAIINDENKEVQHEFIEALTAKNAEHILWSQRNIQENLNKLRLVA